ncbi:MAG: NADH-ubiquinone oxidoreductase-F iron-sulfur binding region domain-containing protein [Pseudomonadota bacterium]|nr:NADH-ubiquinone oxidoreductase-F iron-sulfur binding region domain-containing protein [Pseudomonadota bacterium]
MSDTPTRIFLPGDTTACALGADAVAQAVAHEAAARGLAVDVIRNGSRGLYWLEPLLEVQVGNRRIGYGPVSVAQVGPLFEGGLLRGAPAPGFQGEVDELPALRGQTRVTFSRAGIIDPLSLRDYRQLGGYRGLTRALTLCPADIVNEIENSGLRGRGGAAFPTGVKWRTVLEADPGPDGRKYVVCNADEGDSGTFADRLLMEADPFQLIEGMTIAGLATGADRGYIYLRSEYPRAAEVLHRALAVAREAGVLGDDLLGSRLAFDIELRIGAGAYICGEETALLESLEGRRGLVRVKPPLPAIHGLFGQPTVVNNVLTLAAASTILADGAAAYRQHGTGRSAGTLTVQLAGNVRHGGLYEVPFGAPLRTLLEEFGGGTASGRPLRAVQVGGPLGAYLPETQWDLPLDYEAFAAAGALLGHGGVVLFDETVDMRRQARFAMEFCAAESCGKCTPCRVGAVRGAELIDRIAGPGDQRALLEELCETMEAGSLCAMGGLTPMPVRSALAHFPEDFHG